MIGGSDLAKRPSRLDKHLVRHHHYPQQEDGTDKRQRKHGLPRLTCDGANQSASWFRSFDRARGKGEATHICSSAATTLTC
jgi:hypothetical protein